MGKILVFIGKVFLFASLIIFSIKCTVSNPDELNNPLFVDATQLDHDIATSWNGVMNDLERYTQDYKSPIAARSMAYINLAAYESIVPGMSDRFNSIAEDHFGVELPKVQPEVSYIWALVINSCYKYAIQKFYSTAPTDKQQLITDTYNRLLLKYSESGNQEIIKRSTDYGRQVAEAVYQWSKQDQAGDAAYLNIHDDNFTPVAGLGKWQPTYPDYTPAVLPHWGQVRTFVSKDVDFAIPEPLSYTVDSTSRMFREMKYVKNRVEFIKNNPDNDNYWIAQFWSDDFSPLTFTPAGRWDAIATQIIVQENSSLADAAVLYTKVCLALSDAAVGCWLNKYKYSVERPVQYIRTNIQPEWNTMMKPGAGDLFYTPATPSYPSEHAAFAVAATTVLTNIFGDQYRFTDRCHEGRTEFKGDPRTYYRFQDMAGECAYSRLQIGVCTQQDVDAGMQLGSQVGSAVNYLSFRK